MAAKAEAAGLATSVTATSRAPGRVAIASACMAAITPAPTIPKPRIPSIAVTAPTLAT